MKKLQKTLVRLFHLDLEPSLSLTSFIQSLNRKNSQDSSSSKKESKASGSSSAAAPPPPPNSAKPLPFPGGSAPNSHINVNNHVVSSQGTSSSSRTSPSASIGHAIQDRRVAADTNGPTVPPIVVVGPEANSEVSHRPGPFSGMPERHLSTDHGNATPPRVTPLSRLRAAPKDTIPIVGKPPRKQRSSRFVVTERVEIERLPPFMGKYPTRVHFNIILILLRNSATRTPTTLCQEITSMPRLI